MIAREVIAYAMIATIVTAALCWLWFAKIRPYLSRKRFVARADRARRAALAASRVPQNPSSL